MQSSTCVTISTATNKHPPKIQLNATRCLPRQLVFLPNSVEPRIRKRPKTLEIVNRIARFNPVSGMVLDWLTVTAKPCKKKSGELEDTENDD